MIQPCCWFQTTTGIVQTPKAARYIHGPGLRHNPRQREASGSNSRPASRNASVYLKRKPAPASAPASHQYGVPGEARCSAVHNAYRLAVQKNTLGGSMVITIDPALKIGVQLRRTTDQAPVCPSNRLRPRR